MATFIAFTEKSRFCGGFHKCQRWALEQACKHQTLVKIAKARSGEKHAHIVGEASTTGIRYLISRHTIAVKKLRLLNEQKEA
ncbi:hypothetical protein [Gilvimarinus xylanilyticus]|uniref:Uncharacterized protein n=1 Tax=Gilvimarinus xylanilyticus TaxID=2944139 RepID=A0A9X2KTY2_9GAMM|nr:hypothetical protein [Gilvimarinus xylanilyticus]MCP8899263.1 hypothetical protein [Gilvimarinus xylanilyticus]